MWFGNRSASPILLTVAAVMLFAAPAWAQDEPAPPPAQPEPAIVPPAPVAQPAEPPASVEAEKVRAEAEKARAEAEKAKAEAEKAKLEAERARLELEKLRGGETVAAAETPAGYHTHDGFFLRMTAGAGFGGFIASGSTQGPGNMTVKDPNFYGPGGGGSLSIGGAVVDNLILHLDMWGYGSANSNDDDKDLREAVGLWSPSFGVTYYFMPANVYLTGSVGPAILSYSMNSDRHDDHEYEVGYGLALTGSVGKEWWVSDNWGLGIAVQGVYAFAKGDDLTFNTGGGLLLFSATYN